MFTEPFMQRALLAALFLGPLCALLGVFVTARRLAFFSDTISHAALAGIAVGFWLGLVNQTVPIIIAGLLVAGALLWLKENTDLLTDTIMALLLSGSVSLAIIVLSLLKSYQGELHRFLFGDILAVGRQEVWLAAILLVLLGTGLFARLSPLTLLTTEEEIAQVCGIAVRRLDHLFVLALTVTVALSIRLIGIILVTALLVIPPAAARNLSRNLRQQIVLSVSVGLISGVGGTMLSYQLDVPCGPTIVMASIALFLLSLALRRRRLSSAASHSAL